MWIESFFLVFFRELSSLFDKKYFLKLDFETCHKRRMYVILS